MDDINITSEFNKFSKSINLLENASSDLKKQLDEIVAMLSKNLVEIKAEESTKVNQEIADLSEKIDSKKNELDEFVKATLEAITSYNNSIRDQIENIKVISQGISDDASSKFNKSISTFEDKMKALDEQIQKVYTAGLKSDFDNLSRSFSDLERSYSSLSSIVQGSFIQPISEIKNDLKNLELKIENSFNNTNNNMNNKFDNVINKIELLSKDVSSNNEKVNSLLQKHESTSKKVNIAIVVAGLAFVAAVVAIVLLLMK